MKRVPPPFFFLIGIALQYVLDRYVPLFWIVPISLRWIGWVVIGMSLMMMFWAIAQFLRHRTTVIPHKVPSRMIETGPYRFTRNPLYLGLSIVLMGSALRIGSLTPFAVPFLFAWMVGTFVISMEEENLERQFGKDYGAYKSRVRRWI